MFTKLFDSIPIVAADCDLCGESIYVGYEYLHMPNGDNVCENCLDEMSRRELYEYLGCERRSA